jgi:hypothetical protein
VEDVVGEDCPVSAVLVVAVLSASTVVDRVEGGEAVGDVGTERGQGRRADHRRDAAWVGGRIEAGKAAARNDPAGREPAILIAEAQIVGDGQALIGEIAADQPVEMVVERLALKPKLLAEGLELALAAVADRRAVEDVDRAVVDVAGLARTILPISGDRRERGVLADVVIDLG